MYRSLWMRSFQPPTRAYDSDLTGILKAVYGWQHPEPLAKAIWILDDRDRVDLAADLLLIIPRPDSAAWEGRSASHELLCCLSQVVTFRRPAGFWSI